MSQPPTIVLHTEHTNKVVWNHLIYVEQKSVQPQSQQSQQQQATGAFIHYFSHQALESRLLFKERYSSL